MVIHHMNVDLNGQVQAQGLVNDFGVEVDSGGTPVLGNGVSFFTKDSVIC